MKLSYPDFFRTATGHSPYLWQCRLACGEPCEGANCDLKNPDEATRAWLTRAHPDACQSRLIDIPTGLGKTAGVVLAWLWNRLQTSEDSPWPRRLVYCLPMRTLVEQTEGEVKNWLSKVGQAASLSPLNKEAASLCPSNKEAASLSPPNKEAASLSPSNNPDRQAACSTFQRPRVVVLMGGEALDGDAKEWDLYPEDPAILIGAQDMLLSRALNRKAK